MSRLLNDGSFLTLCACPFLAYNHLNADLPTP